MFAEFRGSRCCTELAIARNCEEQHETIQRLDALSTMIVQLQESMFLEQSMNANAQIELRNTVSNMQLVQALDIISNQYSIDRESNFEMFITLRKFATRAKMDSSLTSPKPKGLGRIPRLVHSVGKSAIQIAARGRDLCSNALLWTLRDREQQYSLPMVLKSLILQALSHDYSSHTDTVSSFQLRRYLVSQVVENHVNLAFPKGIHYR